MSKRSGAIRLPLGVQDHLPERARLLAHHNEAVGRAFHLAGYDRVETPLFELVEVLERGLGAGSRDALFRVVDPSTGEVLVLRPDFTAQVARMVVARMSERPRPLRLRYQGRVLRAVDALGRGLKSRDVFQAGVELIGGKEPWADAEVLALGAAALAHVPRPLTLDLGHARIVEALLPDGADRDEVHAALAVKDGARIQALAPALVPLLELFGGFEVLDRAREVLRRAPLAVHEAIDELERVGRDLATQAPGVVVSFDLGEQRGLGYYTGVFFHGYLPGASDAVVMGGRYDHLLASYGRAEPAVGLAIDVDAIATVLSAADVERSGYVFAEVDLARPALSAALAERRRAGERAVIVARDGADAYARAHGYRVIVERSDAGAIVERVVSGEADR